MQPVNLETNRAHACCQPPCVCIFYGCLKRCRSRRVCLQVWKQADSENASADDTLAGIVRVPLDLLPLTSDSLVEPVFVAKGTA